MGFEIDFIAVGDGKKSGDAIAFRYGNLFGSRSEQRVVVIDGGTKETGRKLVQHIEQYYQTDFIDIVISSHPDADHASGLTEVLENAKVGNLLMHLPWNHASEVRQLLQKRYTVGGLENALVRALSNVSDLEDLAKRKGVPIYEPFSDSTDFSFGDGYLRILGPSRAYYQELLCDFRETPEARTGFVASLGKAASGVGEVLARIRESFGIETLTDDGVTSAENNSSVILLLEHDGERALFTADAGIPALTRALDLAVSSGIDLGGIRFFQVPHHGSKRNIGPNILNRITPRTGFISCCADGAPKHPSQRVVNAVIRRGGSVFSTKGTNTQHHHNAPNRGWWSATPLAFIEEFDD